MQIRHSFAKPDRIVAHPGVRCRIQWVAKNLIPTETQKNISIFKLILCEFSYIILDPRVSASHYTNINRKNKNRV